MALFIEKHRNDFVSGGRSRGNRIGWAMLSAALVGTLAFTLVPAPYVIEEPGPVFNTLGSVKIGQKSVPLIDIPGQKTFPTSGSLDMLTVNVFGSREDPPSWFDVAQAYLDSSKAVLPVDEIYPPGVTEKQSNEQADVDMQNSQQDAIAAALSRLGYVLPTSLTVGAVDASSPSDGVLIKGDKILTVGGQIASTVPGLRAIVKSNGTATPLSIVVNRGGVQKTVAVKPVLSEDDEPEPIVGIFPAIVYTYPFKVKIQLDDVGGPSAGQLFALGIIDKLTPGFLTGGAKVAGTGTIDGAGQIGPIGGIRQKLYGARSAGATWFLAPLANCDEVTGHIPDGIRVLAVRTLDDSLKALKAIKAGSGTGSLLACPSE